MKRLLFPLIAAVLAMTVAFIARPSSPGSRLEAAALEYARSLDGGDASRALQAMEPAMKDLYCESFLLGLQGSGVPEGFRFDGTDQRGVRMTGEVPGSGSRVIWFSSINHPMVVHDTAIENLMGEAVLQCRQNAMADPSGSCPVSGKPYSYDTATGTVICSSGHLGEGITVNSGGCAARRDSVAAEVADYIAAGFGQPATLEEMYDNSSGEYGRRGGYRCPDNGYSYYEIRDGAVFCPFHEEASPIPVTE